MEITEIILSGVGTGFSLYCIVSLIGYAFRSMINLFKE